MSHRKPLASINVTPLVDVLLILVVILMLAVPLSSKKIPVTLPQTSLDAAPSVKNTMKVALQAGGVILVDNTPTDLVAFLVTVKETSSVEVYPDAKVSYDELAKFVAAIQEKHPQDVSLMSQ